MSKGRGSLFALQTPVETGSVSVEDASTKDSGLEPSVNSMSQTKRVGRGKLLENLAASFSEVSLGRGATISTEASSSETSTGLGLSKDTLRLRGRGRAQVFLSLMDSTPQKPDDSESVVSSSTDAVPQAASSVVSEEPQDTTFYMPDNVYGNNGKVMNMTCNFIRLHKDPSKGVYMYEVRFKPPVDSISLRMKLLNEHRERLGGAKTFDGQHLLLPIRLDSNVITLQSTDKVKNCVIDIIIEFKREETVKQCMHLYNVLFDRVLKTLSYVRFGRKQFDPTEAKILPHAKLEIWPGYITAVDEYDGGLMLCCDVSHRLLFQKTVLEMLREIYRMNADRYQDGVKKALLGSVVITRYNDRTYRIDDVRFDLNPMCTFQTKNGEISYYEYYRKAYSIEIKDKKQPLLLSIKKQMKNAPKDAEDLVFCLVPELCCLTGLRDDMRSDFKLMRELATFTKVSPNQRVLALRKFYDNVNNNAEARGILSAWGLTLDSSIMQMKGRELEEEQIVLAKRSFAVGPQADFSRHVVSNEILEVVHLHTWLLLHCKNDMRAASTFWENLDRCSRALGIQVRQPKMIVLASDRTDAYVNALRTNIDANTQVVVCICPTSRDDRYAAIKRICCSEIPIPSQVNVENQLIRHFTVTSCCAKKWRSLVH